MAQLKLKQLDSVLTGSLQISGSAGVTGSLGLSGDILLDEDQRIYFEADKKTWIESNGANLIRTVANNQQMLLLDHETGNRAVFGNGTKVFIGDNNNALPTKELEVVGDVSASGHISGSGIYSDGPITLSDSGPSTPNAKILVRSSNNNLNIGDTIVVTDGNNRVGMGDTAPSSPDTELHIKSDTPVITLQRTDNEDRGAIEFQGQGGSVGAHIEYVSETNDLSFGTFDGSNVVERLRLVDGTNANIKVSGSTQITGSLYVSSNLYGDGSNLSGITSGIFQQTGSVQSATADLQLSGSLVVSGSTLTVRTGTDSGPVTASTAIITNNIQNGYPTSNAWGTGLDGSYFNNFDNTTHVSEILRFIAGAMSHSLDVADASPNTKFYNSIDTNETNTSGTDSIDGYLPTNYTGLSNATLDYLVHKGWTSVGATVFSGISVYHDNGPTYFIDFDSNSGGSTSVQSSADSELFSLGSLTSGGPTQFDVRVIATQSFSDNSSNASPNQSSNTFTTQSFVDYSISSFGTSNGLTLAKIATSQPAVIPSAYQDGKFENVGGTALTGSLTRKYGASATDFTSVSSSGYYNFHGLKVGIKSGSQAGYVFKDGSDTKKFWAPIDQIETNIGSNSLADVGTAHRALTATSRSLSGVPYLIDATFEVSTKITGLFNPMYRASTTLVDMTAGSVGVGSVSISGDTISTSGGTIQTSGKVFQSDGTTAVNSGVPRYNDIAIVTGSVTFDSGTADNIQQSATFTDSTFTVATKARNRANSQSTLDTQTITYHTAGDFNQPVASGSLGIYGREQGYDGGALDGTTETFSGEDFRIKLLDNVQEFNGTAWTTTFELGQLGNYDLQVKPGFLVDPGGDYRYWFPADYGDGVYKYYIRRFQTDGGTKTSMTVNLNNTTLVNWNSTSNGIGCAILFESSGKNSGNNSALGVARIYDPTATTSNLIEANISNDNHKNPFTTAISLYGNSGGSIASNTYTIPIRNADGMYLDSSDNELYIIVRYKGDPTPLDDITLTFS